LHVLLDVDLHRVLAASPAVVRTGCFPDEVPHRVGQAVVPSYLALSGKGCCQGVLALVLERAWALALVQPVLRQAWVLQAWGPQALLLVLEPQVSQLLLGTWTRPHWLVVDASARSPRPSPIAAVSGPQALPVLVLERQASPPAAWQPVLVSPQVPHFQIRHAGVSPPAVQ